jgi:hypothetical protein
MSIDVEHIQIFVLGLIVASVIGVLLYWKGDFHKSEKFKVFFSTMSGIAILFGIFAIVIQTLSFKENVKSKDVEFFDNLTKSFIHDILRLFIENQDMNYYYYDLMGIERINSETVRNLPKENEISMLIYAKSASVLYYIQIQNENKATKGLQSRFNNIMTTFLSSPTFRGYWPLYNKNLAGDPIRVYFKKYFNI